MQLDEGKFKELLKKVERLELENKELRSLKQKFEQNNLEKNNYFFNQIVDNLPGYIAIVDIDTLVYELVNKKFQSSFGIPREKIIGSHIKDVIGESNYQFALKYINEVRQGKSVSYENTFNLQEGKRWIKVNYNPFFDDNGKVTSIVVLSYDITDKKLIEIELKKSHQFLQIANSTKDKFFSIIAHDLKSPFNSILGLSELILTEPNLCDEAKINNFIDAIHTASQNAYRLLENLLDWSRSQSGIIEFNPQEFDLTISVHEVLALAENSVSAKKITLNFKIPENLFVFADKNMINTVLRNLLSNAIKFTNSGGTISIDTSLNEKEAIITISDSGIGMEIETLKHLFDLAERKSTKGTENESGTGLGLILCKEFVEKNGGTIWAESEAGTGSKFYFSIPIHRDHI